MSILEVVRITSHPEAGDQFQARIEAGLAVQAEDPECLSITVRRSVERPDEYLLELVWSSVDAHLAWQERGREAWRAAVGWENVGQIEGLKHYSHVATIKGPESA